MDYGWNWSAFQGSPEGLKWNRRDLTTLDTVIDMTRDRRAVVQAGGNLGIFPKRLAQEFEAVYTFEPAPHIFQMLVHNTPESNVVKFQAALGDTAELIATCSERRDGKTNTHEGITHVSGPGYIPTIRVDSLRLPHCDLLYLDVEGWELYALRGAQETIARCRPVLSVEINKSLGFVGIEPEAVYNFIRMLEYRKVTRILSDEVFVPKEWQ